MSTLFTTFIFELLLIYSTMCNFVDERIRLRGMTISRDSDTFLIHEKKTKQFRLIRPDGPNKKAIMSVMMSFR